jgi:hypothetical protein
MAWKSLVLMSITVFLGSLAAQTLQEESGEFHLPLPPPVGVQAKSTMSLRMDDMEAAPVKGSPFCATVSTEHTQTFADGNRIHTAHDATLCRDSEGRTRREAELDLMGAVPQTSSHKLITIVDPVAGFRYALDTKDKVARKMPILPHVGASGKPGEAAKLEAEDTFFYTEGGRSSGHVFVKKVGPGANGPGTNGSERSPENLGDQTIGGVHATGTRITTTIAAGSMGNEQPILVTSENWYSQELKATVMTKHVDPWAGELKTQFTNVNTSEPDRTMFTVPSDYKVVDEKMGPFVVRMSAKAPM